jgi:hypothetical protein
MATTRDHLLSRIKWLGYLVGLLWLVHGMEKLLWLLFPAFVLPAPLHGGTGSVVNILQVFARDNPQEWFRAFVSTFMLPLGALNQYGVMLLEIGLGLVFLAGPRLWNRQPLILYGAAATGIVQQLFIWMGFYYFEWPFTYLLMIAAHMVVALTFWQSQRSGNSPDFGLIIRVLLGAVWLYEGIETGNAIQLILGAAMFAGLLTPVAALGGLIFVLLTFIKGGWGAWWWVYYFAIADHLYVIIARSGRWYGVDAYLSQRFGAQGSELTRPW